MSTRAVQITEKIENQVSQVILYIGAIDALSETYRSCTQLRLDSFLFHTVYESLWDGVIARIGTEYLFNTKKNQHFFCKVCGVRPFGIGNVTPIGEMYGVNIGCLEGITEEEFSQIPITYIDGMNDRQEAPTHCAHL